uniref:C-type lectin domain-containing protein n=1 Tax=Amphiprion percula TaxID=161767 RepID=A0A3P8T964_AMPPE
AQAKVGNGSETQCPPGWLADGRSCYTVRRAGLTWSDAQHSCSTLAAGSHLVNLKTLEDLLFLSSYLLTHDNLLLLWTGLNDQQVAILQKNIFLILFILTVSVVITKKSFFSLFNHSFYTVGIAFQTQDCV